MPTANGSLRANRLHLIILLVITFGLSGCIKLVDFENTQLNYQDALAYVDADNSLGQTFINRRNPVVGIHLWLRLSENVQDLDSSLIFRIYSDINKLNEIYSGQISYRQIRDTFPIHIIIPGQELVDANIYYLELKSTGTPVWVYGRNDDVYASGNFFRNGKPEFSDLAFQLTYAYQGSAILQDLKNLLQSVWLILPLGILLISPGWFFIHLAKLRQHFEISDLIAIALGISLTLPVVFITWTSLLNIVHNSQVLMFAFGLIAIGAIILELRFNRKIITAITPEQRKRYLRSVFTSKSTLTFLLLVGIFGLALFTRFAMVRDLIGPVWVDSVHHTLITNMIKEAGHIPETFLPFANASATNYHTGFHVIAWINSVLSTQFPVDGILILGQVLNAGIVFAAYLLGHSITGSRLAGLVGALVVGFLTPMPAYYTSWGRYTQLAGLIVLPTAFVLLRMIYMGSSSEKPREEYPDNSWRKQNWVLLILASIVNAGLFMVHSRVAIFLACLILSDILITITIGKTKNRSTSIKLIPLLFSIGCIFLLAAPTLIPVATSLIPQRAIEWTGSEGTNLYNLPWRFLTAGLGDIALFLAGAGLLLAVIFNLRIGLLLIGWIALMFLTANLNRFGIPIAGLVSNDSVVISLFLPISVAVGYLISVVYTYFKLSNRVWQKFIGALIVVCLSFGAVVWGAQSIIPLINPDTVFFHSGDRQAAEWINENLPEDVSFLINPAAWGYGMFIGADGGYWISPLSNRTTFPPTLLYTHGNADDIAEINSQVRKLLEISDNPEQLAAFMQEIGSDYVFLGVKGGPIKAISLLESSFFEPVYHDEGVWIFRSVRP